MDQPLRHQTDPALEVKRRVHEVVDRIWRVIQWLSTPVGRLLLLLPLAAIFLALLYAGVWRPITAPAQLPVGITEQRPMIAVELLEQLNIQRAAREGYHHPAILESFIKR